MRLCAIEKTKINQFRYLDGGEGGDNSRTAKSVRDERKMRQVALDVGLQDDLRSCVAQRRPILVEQVHQLFGDLPEKREFTMKTLIRWMDNKAAKEEEEKREE